MDTKNIHVAEKIKKLLEIVLSYYGKEIALSSVQHFSFDQIIDEENSIQGKYKYHIQYGFPQSGCVNMIINYRKDVNSFSVDKISVYAPTSDKDFVVTNFGVKPDGITINTTSLQSLIDRVNIKGGGRIVFPEGKFLTGCLHLKSKVELHFQGEENPDACVFL